MAALHRANFLAKTSDVFNGNDWPLPCRLNHGQYCAVLVMACTGLPAMAVTMTPLQFAVEMAEANTVVAAAAAASPLCRAAAYA